MTEPTPVSELGYADALAELESILDRLEHDEPDVDRVADDVARATELIVHCRSRISAARIKVERVEEVVGDLAPDPASRRRRPTTGRLRPSAGLGQPVPAPGDCPRDPAEQADEGGDEGEVHHDLERHQRPGRPGRRC